MVGLMATSLMPYPGLLHPESLPLRQSTTDPYPPQESIKESSVSVYVGSLGPGAHKVCLSPQSIVQDGYLEKAEESEIKLPISIGSSKKQESFRKNNYFCFIDYAKAFDCVDHIKLWKILKEMGIPGHLTCLLRNLYAGQEATVRTGHETTDWFQIGKGVRQGYILSPCLFNVYAEYIM